jgi:hypothetical protein
LTAEKATDAVLLKWLDSQSAVKKDGMSAAQVHTLVSKRLRINMGGKDTE